MDNKLLSKIYLNIKRCPFHKVKVQGTILENGLIKLVCGCTTKADRRWEHNENGLSWTARV